jgi:peptidoglycan/xylan/chitin deacetylase (PgdA/CDA1 family)
MIQALLSRASGKGRRFLAGTFEQQTVRVAPSAPLISFTFDDAPASAFSEGGAILEAHGARGSYYVALGLLGSRTEVGQIASLDDLARAVDRGHELGCHTYDHLDAWTVSPREFMASVHRNRQALERILPGEEFSTFAYPKSGATLAVKSPLSQVFKCCRGGGQGGNAGTLDRNLVRAYFIAGHNGMDVDAMRRLIDRNVERRGWLVFVTHDVAQAPSPFGCARGDFAGIVAYAKASGARLLPVREAFDALDPRGATS